MAPQYADSEEEGFAWMYPLARVTTGDYFECCDGLEALMKAVGIKEMKARLSEYVRAVRAGEVVLVTDRGEVVAELRPPTERAEMAGTLEGALAALKEAGEVTRATRSKENWTWTTRGLGLDAGSAARLLDELRAERDGS
jgi:prevent-host-death family protein